MGEHGPHAIIHGPDGWLYLVIGNHAWAQIGPKTPPNPEKLAANSPLLRWPTGRLRPRPGQHRHHRGRAAAAAERRPRPRRQHPGPRRHHLAARSRRQEPVAWSRPASATTTTPPSTPPASCSPSTATWNGTKRCRGIGQCASATARRAPTSSGAPARPTRRATTSIQPAAHSPRPAAARRSASSSTTTSPFPAKYRGAYFVADWAIGIIFAVLLERDGASYKGKVGAFLHRHSDERDRPGRRAGRGALLHDGRSRHAGRRLPHRPRQAGE